MSSDQSEAGAEAPGASSSSYGGKRIVGERNEKSQNTRTAAIKGIKETWGVDEFIDIFPPGIRPDKDLGCNAISNLRAIAYRVPDLVAARELMTNECVDEKGHLVKLSFKNTVNILNHLKSVQAARAPEKEAEKGKTAAPSQSVSSIKSAPPVKDSVLTKAVAPANALPLTEGAPPAKPSHMKAVATSKAANVRETVMAGTLRKVSMLVQPPTLFGKPKPRAILNNMETASGFHALSAEDENSVPNNKPSWKNMASSASGEMHDEPTTDDVGLEDRHGVQKSDEHLCMTDENGIPIDINNGKTIIPAIGDNDDYVDSILRKLRLQPRELLADTGFVERSEITSLSPTSSEASTEIDPDSVPDLLRENVAIQFSVNDGDQETTAAEKAEDPFVVGVVKKRSPLKTPTTKFLEKLMGVPRNLPKMVDEKKSSENVAAKIILPQKKRLADSPLSTKTAEQGDKSVAESQALLTESVQIQGAKSKSLSKMQDTKKISEKQVTEKLQSPLSPTGPPDPEISIHSEEGRRSLSSHSEEGRRSLAAIHEALLSPTIQARRKNNRTPSTVQASPKLTSNKRARTPSPVQTSSKLTIKKTGNTMSKRGRKDYATGEVSDEEESSKKSTPAWIGKVYPPAKEAVKVPGKPAVNVLPEVNETLAARNPADKDLILAVPQAIVNYLNDLRFNIPDGKAPDGDILSMVICNKLGALVEAAQKCEHELIDLYNHSD